MLIDVLHGLRVLMVGSGVPGLFYLLSRIELFWILNILKWVVMSLVVGFSPIVVGGLVEFVMFFEGILAR